MTRRLSGNAVIHLCAGLLIYIINLIALPPAGTALAQSSVSPAAPPAAATTGTTAFSGSDLDLSPQQLETLVSRVALYPDDLLALVLPASTQPLQVVEAQRFLDQHKADPKSQPPKTWDPSVVALLNYPEALVLMNQDLTWTQQLGTSVVSQQAALMDAVQSFRKKVADAGNLKSDDKQKVIVEKQTIVVQSADPQVVYVPSYNPTTVIYAAGPAYPPPYYYSPPYPYYYSPAATFFTGAVFGAAVGFAVGWNDHNIYHGDVDINRNVNINNVNVDNRVNRINQNNVSSRVNQHRENVWKPQNASIQRAPVGSHAGRAGTGVAAANTPRVNQEQIRSGLAERGGNHAAANRTQAARSGLNGHRAAPVNRAHAPASGAFSGIDSGASAARFNARGAQSLGTSRQFHPMGGGGRAGHFHPRR
jgi:hypothetical protein